MSSVTFTPLDEGPVYDDGSTWDYYSETDQIGAALSDPVWRIYRTHKVTGETRYADGGNMKLPYTDLSVAQAAFS